MTNQQAPEIYALHTVPNKGERPWSGIYAVRADAEHDAKVLRDATGRDWSVVRLVVADTAATPTGPVARYKISYSTDDWGMSSSTPGAIRDAAGAWVRYADHAAQVEALSAAQAVVPAGVIAWMYNRVGSQLNPHFIAAGQNADDLRVGRPGIVAPCANHVDWVALAAAPQPSPSTAPAQPVHVQKPAETEHVAGDVSKNGAETNMNAYAELPPSVGEYKYGGGLYTDAQMRVFADATHALRTQQPAPATQQAGWTNADADAARLALELECLLMDTKDAAVVSKWWASANDALEMHRARLAAPPQPAPVANRLLQLADELDEQLTSGSKWSPAQHACCSVSNALRAMPAAQQWNDLIGKETHADADGLLVWRDEVDFAAPTPQADSVLEDAARLDWLALAGPTSICLVIDRPHDGEVEVSTDDVTGYGKTLREALDAARKQGDKP